MEVKNILDVDDLKYIKKHYGENLAKFCRSKFPTILEYKGVLATILSTSFVSSHSIYEDLEKNEEFGSLIWLVNEKAKSYIPEEEKNANNGKTPEELLSEAGYILYPECKSNEDVLKFKKYYAPGEELCSFSGDRTKSCRVWFAVKKNVDKIKREDFIKPQRQDEYGTSVISIQFDKDFNTLSIKNRYNHTVSNPDSTFSNNLENIIPGLTLAFEEEFGIKHDKSNEELVTFTGYAHTADGVRYRQNCSIYYCSYCENNCIVTPDGNMVKYDTSRYILFNNYLLDLKEKKVVTFDGLLNECRDEFIDSIYEYEGDIQKIEIDKVGENKVIHIINQDGKDCFITIDKHNTLIGYKNDYITELKEHFLDFQKTLVFLDVPNVIAIGDYVLMDDIQLESLNAPNVEYIGHHFLEYNENLKELELPNAIYLGENILSCNNSLERLRLPKVEHIYCGGFANNTKINDLYAPKLKEVGDFAFSFNNRLKNLDLPSLTTMGENVFYNNNTITKINAPNLQQMGGYCFANNKVIKQANFKSLTKMGSECFGKTKIFKYLLNMKVKANNKKSEKNEERQA